MATSTDWSAVAARPRPALPPRFLIGGAILLLAVGYLILTSMGAGTVYYLTVGELQARGSTADQVVRVSGNVVPGSIVREGATVRFVVADADGSLPVTYSGVVPDIFGDEIQVVVEGRPAADGSFEATTLLAKCPSKFESAPAAGGEP